MVVESNIHNSFSCILNILLFLQDNATSPFKKMFSVQHFGSFGSNQYDHGIQYLEMFSNMDIINHSIPVWEEI